MGDSYKSIQLSAISFQQKQGKKQKQEFLFTSSLTAER